MEVAHADARRNAGTNHQQQKQEKKQMFTIKLYTDRGRTRIMAAESFTILRDQCAGGGAEITLHQKNQDDDSRVDVGRDAPRPSESPPLYQRAIIENAAGRTTEIISVEHPAA